MKTGALTGGTSLNPARTHPVDKGGRGGGTAMYATAQPGKIPKKKKKRGSSPTVEDEAHSSFPHRGNCMTKPVTEQAGRQARKAIKEKQGSRRSSLKSGKNGGGKIPQIGGSSLACRSGQPDLKQGGASNGTRLIKRVPRARDGTTGEQGRGRCVLHKRRKGATQ